MQGTYRLRKFTMDDLPSVTKINQICLPENYSDIFFVDLHRRYPETFLVAEENNQVIGYIMCRIEVGLSNLGFSGILKKGHVVSVAVLPDHRRKGVGKSLMLQAMEAMKQYSAKQCYLEVRVTNQEAVSLYKQMGLEVTRTIHGYYADGEDAFLMTANLPPKH